MPASLMIETFFKPNSAAMLKKQFAFLLQRRKLLFLFLLFLSASHFSFAQDKITVSGTVASDSSQPLSSVSISVKAQTGGATTDANGTVTNWMVECGAPNGLLRRGFTKASLPVGTEILMNGWQAKDGSNRANGSDLTLPDGKKLFVGSSNTGAPNSDPEK